MTAKISNDVILVLTNLPDQESAEKLAQIAVNYQTHTHNGKDSHSISHKDLLHVDSEMPVVGVGHGEAGGLDVHTYARRFFTDRTVTIGSVVPNEVHPQYLNKYGYLYGGSQGLYSLKEAGYTTARNMNLFHGDFVFSPIASSAKSYIYDTLNDAVADKEEITWNLTTVPTGQMRGHALIFGSPKQPTATSTKVYSQVEGSYNITGSGSGLKIEVTIPVNVPSDSYTDVTVVAGGTGYASGDQIMFRGPKLGGTTPLNDLIIEIETVVDDEVTSVIVVSGTYAFHHLETYSEVDGAVKMYYEPNIFSNAYNVYYDKTGGYYNLSRHGFVPGNVTNDQYTGFRGLNIGWGNLFFGYREDIFNGRLKSNDPYKEAASTHWRTSEFNILTTANKQAGQNTNSGVKSGYQYRDGFAVKAIQGSNIWLNVGGYTSSVLASSNNEIGKTIYGVPGTIAIEASYPSYSVDPGVNTLKVALDSDPTGTKIASGSGFFTAPGPVVDTVNNKYLNPWSSGLTDHKFAGLWNDNVVLGHPTDTGSLAGAISGGPYDSTKFGPGPILDIFNLAPDRQKENSFSQGSIGRGTDSSLTGWVFGRPFIRGTYGVNFCVDGDFTYLHPDFKTGFHTKQDDGTWGPESAVLESNIVNNQYIHREFRFWGKNSTDPAVSWNANTTANTVGGNINLLYNFGRDYTRFGQNIAWSSTISLSGGTTASPWANSRRIVTGKQIGRAHV